MTPRPIMPSVDVSFVTTLSLQTLSEPVCDLVQRHVFLRQSVAVTDGYGLAICRLTVDGETERTARLVHPCISFTDGLLDVELHAAETRFQLAMQFLGG